MILNNKFYYYTNVVLLIMPSIYTSFFPGKITVITLICTFPLVIFAWINARRSKNEFDGGWVFFVFYILNIVIFFRALLSVNNREDYANLIGMFLISILFPLYLKIVKEYNIIYLLKSIIFCAIPISFVTYFYKPTDAFMSFQHNISVSFLFILCLPFIKNKWRIVVLLLVFLGILYDITRRSFLINSIISLTILLLYVLNKRSLFLFFVKRIYLVFCVTPIVFLYLGINNHYNIFKIGENIEFTLKNTVSERNLFVDSRTGIYEDVFRGLANSNRILFGLGGNGKVATSLVNTSWGEFYKIYAKGRRRSESGMLNYIQWGGLITAFFYWLLLATASFKAIFNSKNGLVLMIGVFVLFKISYSFIEDAISVNMYSFYFIVTLSICFNKKIRSYSDEDIKNTFYLVLK